METRHLETRLDDFDPATRRAALKELATAVTVGAIDVPVPQSHFNLHCHSFFSYNGFGFSPSHIVWTARKLGFAHVGLVDFDVLDGVDEFHAAGRLLRIRTHAGIETRAYLPPCATREINSPGEPGVAYHMGTGFLAGTVPPAQQAFLDDLRQRARQRNLGMLAAVNAFLDPVILDYEADVLPLTPAGVATERHLCVAYQAKAETLIDDAVARAAFWSAKLGVDDAIILDHPVKLQGLIRSKTMKRGGVGYRQPDATSFPLFADMNAFVVACGAIPTMAWLDGSSPGESAIEELLDLHLANGLESAAIIPDRNWNFSDPEVKATRIAALARFVGLCDTRELPIQIGTELNAPGLKLVDDFDAPELAPFIPSFRRGAAIAFGHAVEALAGRGYCSEWSQTTFATRKERNDHYEAVGNTHDVLPA